MEKTDAIVNEWIDSQCRVIDVSKITMKSKKEFIAHVEHNDKSTSYILVGKRRMSGEFCTDHDVPFCVECLTGYYLSNKCCKGRMLLFCVFHFELL